jgi:hypothetical protein
MHIARMQMKMTFGWLEGDDLRMNHSELNKTSYRTRWSFLLISSVATLGILLLLSGRQSYADPYFNSSEPGCNGSDPNKLFCEDFETPGVSGGRWYAEDCDTANRNGGFASRTKGWCGTIYSNPITPAGAEACGSAGVATSCSGHHGALTLSDSGGNMADHGFKMQVDEVYVRYYQRWLTGYRFGAEKVLTFNATPGSGGIKWGNLHLNCGTGSQSSTANLQWQPVGGGFTNCLSIASIAPGNWYYIEVHAKLSTTASSGDGLLQVWVNDCGPAGTTCGTSPTLRLNQQNMSWDRKSSGELLGAVWFENWANPASSGTSYIDQIVVSRTGPVGFMGVGAAKLPPPTNLRIQ